MPISRAVPTALALALSLTMPVGPATAASGSFTYTPPPAEHALTDPPPRCHVSPGGVAVDNLTDQGVELFTHPNCSGIPVTVAPHAWKDHVAFESLRVVRQAGGTLVYATRSAPKTLPKPPLGHCENVAGDGLLLNNTDATALLYGFKNCPGTAAHAVAPGAHLDATFQSVKFVE